MGARYVANVIYFPNLGVKITKEYGRVSLCRFDRFVNFLFFFSCFFERLNANG